jgi:DNA-binding NarL/FixJ family response regulator
VNTSREFFERERLIDRPTLRSALDAALDRRLTLIVAKAGAGKTTLLRQWSESHADRDVILLDIDDTDDDPVQFIRHLTGALAVVKPAVARVSKSIKLSNDGLGAAAIAALVAALESMPDVVILIDNVHRFTNVQLVADLSELVERIPRNVHIVLSSRSDPPIALSRYRLQDDLLEFAPEQLAFSDTESAALLKRIIGHPLEPSQVRALRERTEGWAAGLQLAGLNLRNERNADAFIEEFGGSDRLVADYLDEEVLADLPAERRRLLLEMSALDDMSAGLVEAATGSRDAQLILEELESESMFLVPLDTRREWFRFHNFFSELLRSRLRAENPAGERKILTAAADWHLARGRVKAAMEYLLRAQSRDGALEAVFSTAADLAAHGDVLGLARWSPPVPESRQHPHAPDPHAPTQHNELPRKELGFVAARVRWWTRPKVSTNAPRRSDVVERINTMSALSLFEAWCGNIDQADALVHEALQTARAAGMLAHPSLADGHQSTVLTELERNDPAPGTVHSVGTVRAVAPGLLFERAAASLTSGDTEQARKIVSAWNELVPAPEPLSVVQHHILLARLAADDDALEEATRQLTEAVKVAEVYGLVDVFVRAGPGILRGLSTISGPQAAFSDIIRVRAQQVRAQQSAAPPPLDLADPLTDREVEILAYLPTRFTNVELARRFFVSVNTIKTHMAHIYRKLGVTNRDTAIGRAQELGLL